MRKRIVLIGLTASVVAIFLFVLIQLFWLTKAYDSEKEKFKTYVSDAVKYSVDIGCFELVARTYAETPNTYALNAKSQQVIIIKDDVKYKFPIDINVGGSTDVYSSLYYDMQDTDIFNDTLVYSLVKKRLDAGGFSAPVYFGRIDLTSGEEITSSPGCPSDFGKFMFSDTVPLGYVSNHIFVAGYDYPKKLFISKMSGWLIADSFLLFIAFVCTGLIIHTIVFQKKSSDEREFLMRTIVHELKSPLTYLNFVLGSIRFDPKEEDHFLHKILPRAYRHLDDLRKNIEKILVSTSSGMMLGRQRNFFDLKETLEDVVADFCHRPGSTKDLTLVYDTNIRDVVANQLDLSGAVSALIENAFKYSERDARVCVRVTSNKTHIFISVKDNGFGIAKEDMKRIFDKYFRAKQHYTDSGIKGFGLGLSYVKMVMDAHKGGVRVISELNEGSEFILELPIIKL